MARPTEPGYYWLNDAGWEIVRVQVNSVSDRLEIAFCQYEDTYYVEDYASDSQWGGRITQEPVTDPPPPF